MQGQYSQAGPASSQPDQLCQSLQKYATDIRYPVCSIQSVGGVGDGAFFVSVVLILGFKASLFQSVLVSWFQSFLVSKLLGFHVSKICQYFISCLLKVIDPTSKIFKNLLDGKLDSPAPVFRSSNKRNDVQCLDVEEYLKMSCSFS